ncbi:hypothetical protein OFN34_33890, partial [Escherichia coli]|nr:hypothetical protein [Escherichia coli]
LEETNKRMLNLSNQLELMDEPSAFLLNRLSELEKGAKEKQDELEELRGELSSVERIEKEAGEKVEKNSDFIEYLSYGATLIDGE